MAGEGLMVAPCVVPKVCSQIGSRPQPGGGSDCGPCAVIQALYLASCGKFKIGNKDRRIMLINQVRARGGMPNLGGTQNEDCARAFEAYDAEFAALNLKPPKATYMFHTDFEDTLLEHLSRGKMAVVAGEYGPIDLFQGGAISGQHGKIGPHAFGVVDLRTIGANDWVTIVDPLADHRRADIADGPQNLRVSVLKDSMTQYTDSGGPDAITAFTFFRSGVLVPPDPDPDMTTVPGILNMTEANARAAIIAADLVPGTRSEGASATIAAGRVRSQNPAAGVQRATGTAVNYTVSTGTGPPPDPDPGVATFRASMTAGADMSLTPTFTSATSDTIDPNPASPCGGFCDDCEGDE